MSLAHANAPFLLTFFKRRWLRDTSDLVNETLERGDDTLAFDDVDLDNDLLELRRVGGVEALRGIAHEVLTATGPLPAGPALEVLAPEFEGPAVEVFLRLLAINVAFRVRSDELLADLMNHVAGGAAPRLQPAALGGLLARARPLRQARALLEAGPLSGEALAEAQAAVALAPLDLVGARIHVEAKPEALEVGLERVLRPLERIGWTMAVGDPSRRRFLVHKQRGGWFTVLEEGDTPPAELARQLARQSGVLRAAWVRFGEGDGDADLLLFEGTRVVLDRERLTQRVGGEPTTDDVAGALRAVGVLDLDPAHPRRNPPFRWAAAAGLDFKKRSIRSYCFA